MIANRPAHFCISFIHLSIALFCFAFFVGFVLTDKEGSLYNLMRSNDFLALIICFLIGCIALAGFVFWQKDDIALAKKINYLVSFSILIQYLVVVVVVQKMKVALALGLLLFSPMLFIFLLALSKVGIGSKVYELDNDNILDTDFLKSSKTVPKHNYFLKINRIVATLFFMFAIMMVINNVFNKLPNVFIPIYTTLFVLCGLLLIFPKIGSWVSSIFSLMTGIGVFGFVVYNLFFKNNDTSSFENIVFGVSTVFSVSLFLIGIAMLLLSKEAKEEWKK
ncbi:hypothetical protein WAF17_17045 [Bernardetia sp. ABR2-2B]|uniref:hypothetical protein n=1 Tax=Bernardetia sp. ABR2-2B TaxID=3127472 RepID=UPI0030D27476